MLLPVVIEIVKSAGFFALVLRNIVPVAGGLATSFDETAIIVEITATEVMHRGIVSRVRVSPLVKTVVVGDVLYICLRPVGLAVYHGIIILIGVHAIGKKAHRLVQVELAFVGHIVACGLQHLGHRLVVARQDLLARLLVVVGLVVFQHLGYLVMRREHAGKQRGAAGRAGAAVAVRALERQAVLQQPVHGGQIRCRPCRIIDERDRGLLVGDKENDVRFLREIG